MRGTGWDRLGACAGTRTPAVTGACEVLSAAGRPRGAPWPSCVAQWSPASLGHSSSPVTRGSGLCPRAVLSLRGASRAHPFGGRSKAAPGWWSLRSRRCPVRPRSALGRVRRWSLTLQKVAVLSRAPLLQAGTPARGEGTLGRRWGWSEQSCSPPLLRGQRPRRAAGWPRGELWFSRGRGAVGAPLPLRLLPARTVGVTAGMRGAVSGPEGVAEGAAEMRPCPRGAPDPRRRPRASRTSVRRTPGRPTGLRAPVGAGPHGPHRDSGRAGLRPSGALPRGQG